MNVIRYVCQSLCDPECDEWLAASHTTGLAMHKMSTNLFPVHGVWLCVCVSTGLIGTAAALAYGGYAYKNRGPMSTSRYLMRLRVIAQGAVVLSMILGASWSSLRSSSTRTEHWNLLTSSVHRSLSLWPCYINNLYLLICCKFPTSLWWALFGIMNASYWFNEGVWLYYINPRCIFVVNWVGSCLIMWYPVTCKTKWAVEDG